MNGSYSTKERIDQARLLNKYDFTDITNSFKIPRSAKDISLQSNQRRLDWDSVAGNVAWFSDGPGRSRALSPFPVWWTSFKVMFVTL